MSRANWKDEIMSENQFFASPIIFSDVAVTDGMLVFSKAAIVPGKEALKLGKIYIKTDSPCEGENKERSIDLEIEGHNFSAAEFSNLARMSSQIRAGCPKVRGKFYDCRSDNPGIDPPVDAIVAKQFVVEVTLSGYAVGDFIRGTILLEVLEP